MAAYVNYDILEVLEEEERGGALHSLTRLCRVTGLSANDYSVLDQALAATDPEPIPAVPSLLMLNGSNTFCALDERHISITDKDKGTADVRLVYRHLMDGTQELYPTQNILLTAPGSQSANGGGILFGKRRTSMQQFPINHFTDWSHIWDASGQTGKLDVQTYVQHVYPDGTPGVQTNDPDHNPSFTFATPFPYVPSTLPPNTNPLLNALPGAVLLPYSGGLWVFPRDPVGRGGVAYNQAGEIQAQIPMDTYSIEGYVECPDINVFIGSIAGKVNDFIFGTSATGYDGTFLVPGDARQWLCSEVESNFVGPATAPGTTSFRFKVRIEWIRDPYGWDQYIVFIDSETGKPAIGLIKDIGYKKCAYLPPLDIPAFFGVSQFL